ncbi:MAG: TIM barrel protein [Candidatus Diapherotrites archaeon]
MSEGLLFGPAGIPNSTRKPNTVEGIKRVKELGLECMELEFVHSINIKKGAAPEVKKTAKENSIRLTVHAPYYINLNSLSKQTIGMSKSHVINSAKIGFLCGAESVAFHAAYYMKMDSQAVYDRVKKEMQYILNALKEEGIKIWVRPETTGKHSQFGTLEEILSLSEELEMVMPCIDFSHMHARTQKLNSREEFEAILESVEKKLGKKGLQNLHCHVSGINYSEKGERNHMPLKESDFNYKELLQSLKEFKAKGFIVCESPNLEEDALLLKKTYEKI